MDIGGLPVSWLIGRRQILLANPLGFACTFGGRRPSLVSCIRWGSRKWLVVRGGLPWGEREGHPEHVFVLCKMRSRDRAKKVVYHDVGFPRDFAVAENVHKVVLLDSAKIARLCRGNMWAVCATSSCSVLSYSS